MEARLDDIILEDGTYTLSDLEAIVGTIEVSGNKPSGGSVEIKDGVVVTDSTTILTVGDYTVSYDTDGKIFATKKAEGEATLAALCEYQSEDESQKYAYGAEYKCNLGDGDRTFYLLEDGDNTEIEGTTTGEGEVALLLDRNYDNEEVPLCANTTLIQDGYDEYYICEDDYPSGTDAKFNKIASAWIKLSRDQIGLPSSEQILTVIGIEDENHFDSPELLETNSWLFANFGDYGSYWTSLVSDGEIGEYAYISKPVAADDELWFGISGDYPNVTNYVRPVITIPKN